MIYARVKDGTVTELLTVAPEVLALPAFTGPTEPSRTFGPEQIADIERRCAESRPFDLDVYGLVPVVDVKPVTTPSQIAERTGWTVTKDSVRPVYAVKSKPMTELELLADKIEAIERDIVKTKPTAEPIGKI